jgi:hypothetical protein
MVQGWGKGLSILGWLPPWQPTCSSHIFLFGLLMGWRFADHAFSGAFNRGTMGAGCNEHSCFVSRPLRQLLVMTM